MFIKGSKKILYVINNLDTGGAERLLVEILPRLKRADLKVDVLILNSTNFPLLRELRENQAVTVLTIGNHSLYNPILILKLAPIFKRYMIVHVHLFPSLYWVAIAKIVSFSKTILVYTEHSTTNRRRNHSILKWVDRIIYRQYLKIVTVSTEVKFGLIKHLKMKSSRFVTIPNGIDLQKFQDAVAFDRSSFTNDDNEKIIIQVSRFTSQKDQETVIRALPFINKPIRLLLVGKGEGMEELKILVDSLELSEKVFFLGIRTDVPNLLKMADVAVLSSHYEGLSLSGLEAMASGTPLVASNVPGLSNLVFGAGALFIHRDETDLACEINRLLEDTGYYAEMVNKCIERAKKYSIEKMVMHHLILYRHLWNEKF